MTFDLQQLFVRQGALPPDFILADRFTNCWDVSDAVVPISRDRAPLFDLFDVLPVERFNQLFPFDDSGDAVEPVKRTRKRKPTVASVIRQMQRAGVEVAGCDVRPDGTISIVTGKPVGDIDTNDTTASPDPKWN